MPIATLPDRALLRIAGADAEHFLQNLITTDLAQVPQGEAWPGALLTPQGKILFDFLVSRDGDGFLLETTVEQLDGLTKRLTMYKLRAAVSLEALPVAGVTVSWDEATAEGLVDHRFQVAGTTVRRFPGTRSEAGDVDAYHALRTGAGIAESGTDYALQDAFPHDVLFDRMGGVSFRKGCYVGQEVVSRMQHRSTARRRVVLVTADQPLPASGTAVTIEGKSIGTLGTVCGKQGLAIARIDKAGEAMASGLPIMAENVIVTLALPEWSGITFPTSAEES
ncbi:YgfZ/GcvT domain-containing protein [Peteryoungia ipomoeae]|uniref:Folate-binding protein YgfZ n=1 Tax=Peteryoungia ipomoeae TaxID=1210932 RepID=A0A4S8P9G1_9HYPH|nr:folate-binding protein YgfZ [Peteryoungia ipomoeae]THV25722.1 folate-binding protein YgfZ [Peteryoungia ipomoeae]